MQNNLNYNLLYRLPKMHYYASILLLKGFGLTCMESSLRCHYVATCIIVKSTVSPIFFFVTLNSQKIYLNQWNHQNNGSVKCYQ